MANYENQVSWSNLVAFVNGKLKELYPTIKRYGNDDVDGAAPPYFFVECVPYRLTHSTKNMQHKSCSMKITYVQKTPNQIDSIRKADEICSLIGMMVDVNERKLLVKDFTYEFIGEDNNILQISYTHDWWESTQEEESGELVETVHTSIKRKEE